jgi:hypothetical protein
MFREEFPPEQDWFKDFRVGVDRGFLGIEKDYVCKELLLPNKKKKKQELSPEQKQENKLLASERIVVEYATGGMKHYRILSDRLRVQDVKLYNVIFRSLRGTLGFPPNSLILNTATSLMSCRNLKAFLQQRHKWQSRRKR